MTIGAVVTRRRIRAELGRRAMGGTDPGVPGSSFLYADRNPSHYEEDHLVSFRMGSLGRGVAARPAAVPAAAFHPWLILEHRRRGRGGTRLVRHYRFLQQPGGG